MQYLVTGESVHAVPMPLELLEQRIIPSLDACAKLKSEKKILAGGIVVGGKAAAFVLEAESNEEASQILQNLPCWELMKWDVTPLESFEARAVRDREILARVKASSQ